jgi:hypothetical protein
MCPGHWRQVPRSLRSAVLAAWQDGAGSGTAAHAAAVDAAIRAVNAKASRDTRPQPPER